MSIPQNTHRKTSSVSSVSSNLLAEQFERDRKSIIYYCFTKHGLDKQGSPIHQYYTHVRVLEDQLYNNSKPPANYQSLLTNKKKRILIISFNKQLKQPQVHKARENSDGSIQIGRTWLLKDLTQVINNTDNNEGFIMNMNKTYYWETNSGRERTAFIKTLVKIYMDHFTNHVPELIGWDLGMWYLNEASYKRALINPLTPTQHVAVNKGLTSQPIVNQRVASTLNDRDIKASANTSKPPKYNENIHHRRSPSVQGKPQFESIRENSTEDLVSEARDVLQSKSKSSSTPPPKMFSTSNDPNMGVRKPIMKPVVPATPITKAGSQEVSPLDSAENLMNFYEDDATSQQLEFIEDMNYSGKGINSPVKKTSPLKQVTKADDLDIERSLEDELIKLNEASLLKTQTPVKSFTVDDEHIPNTIDDGEGMNFDNLDFDSNPIDFESIHESPSKQKNSANNVESDDDIDDETLVQIMDAIDWNMNDDMKAIINKFEVKNLDISNIYSQSIAKIVKEFDSNNKESQYNQKIMEIKDAYESIDKIQTYYRSEYSKYETETYDILKADDSIKLLAYNSKTVKDTMENVIRDLEINKSDLQGLLSLEFNINNLHEIESILVKLFKAISITRKASNFYDDDSYTWVNKLVDLESKSHQYETMTDAFIKRFTDFFESDIMASISKKKSLSEMSSIIPYNSILLFIKLISTDDFKNIMDNCKRVLDDLYTKMIDDCLFEIKELIQPRRKTLVGNSSHHFINQTITDTASGLSNVSSNVASSYISSTVSMLEYKNFDDLLKSWKEYVKTKKVNILVDYEEPTVLINVIKSFNFIQTLPLHYQNFLCVFFHLNSNDESSDLSLFLKSSPIPIKRIVNLSSSLENEYKFDTKILETRWNLCSEIFGFKLTNFFNIVTSLIKMKYAHLLNPLMFAIEKKIYDIVNYKNSVDWLFVQNTFESFMAKIKLEIEGFVESKIIEFQRYKLSISKDKISNAISKLEIVVQNVTLFYYAVFQDIEFLIHNLSISEQNKVVPVTRSLITSSYEKFCKVLVEHFLAVYEMLNLDEKILDTSSTAVTDADQIKSGVDDMLKMNFLCGYCTEFLSLYNTSEVVSDYLSDVKKKQNDFFKPKLSEILIKENFFKLYTFVKSSWAIIDSNSLSNDPSMFMAYSGNNLNQILLDYNSDVITKIIENIYMEIVKYSTNLEKSIVSQLADTNSQLNKDLVSEFMTLFVSKIWSSIQGDLVSFFLSLYSLIDKYYSKGPNKIETALKFNKNDVIQTFIRIKKENNLQ
ncbi:hypothetical protein ACO0R3_000121 [Hanseniaspora guilliermondii]